MLLPTQADVAALLRAYTTPEIVLGPTNPASTSSGVFTESTTPTALQVDELIERHATLVYASVGSNTEQAMSDEILRKAVANVIAIAAAAEVARSYTPNALGNAADVHASLRAQFTEELRIITEAVREYRSTGAPDAGNAMTPGSSGSSDDCYPCHTRYPYQARYPLLTDW